MSETQEEIMNSDGFVTASAAAGALGVELGTIHRRIGRGELTGSRVGKYWYVSVHSLLTFTDAPALLKRIKALGVKPNPEHAGGTAVVKVPGEKEETGGKRASGKAAK